MTILNVHLQALVVDGVDDVVDVVVLPSPYDVDSPLKIRIYYGSMYRIAP